MASILSWPQWVSISDPDDDGHYFYGYNGETVLPNKFNDILGWNKKKISTFKVKQFNF